MTLSRTIADGGNNRQLLEIMSDPKRREHRSDMGRTAQPDQMRKLQVERPDLELDPLIEELPPQLALDGHQARPVCFLLQQLSTIGVVTAVQMDRMIKLAHLVKRRKGEIGRELPGGFVFGARQMERAGAIPLPKHALYLTSQQAA